MSVLKRRAQARADHERFEREMAKAKEMTVDMAIRLVRLEAEVDIYRPFYLDDDKKIEP